MKMLLGFITISTILSCSSDSSSGPSVTGPNPNSNGFIIEVPECTIATYYSDQDGDGFGVEDNAIRVCPEEVPASYVSRLGDPDDTNLHIYPGASCGRLAHGELKTRTAYESPEVGAGFSCKSEHQEATCDNGVLSSWSGSYAHSSCNGKPFAPSFVRIEFEGELPTIGKTLTCKAAGASDSDSLASISYEYQWYRGASLIGTAKTYTLASEDEFQEISCRSNAVDGAGSKSSVMDSDNRVTGVNAVCESEESSNAFNWSSALGKGGARINPFAICTKEQFKDFLYKCGYLSSSSTTQSCASHIEILADIDMGGFSGGQEYMLGGPVEFEGTIQGNRRTISNMTLSRTIDYHYIGLFAYLRNAEVSSIRFKNITVDRSDHKGATGGLIGRCISSEVEDISFSGTVLSSDHPSALLSYGSNCLINRFSVDARVEITATQSSYSYPTGATIGELYDYNQITNGRVNIELAVSPAYTGIDIGLFGGEIDTDYYVMDIDRIVLTGSVSSETEVFPDGAMGDYGPGFGVYSAHIQGEALRAARNPLETLDDFKKMIIDNFDLDSVWIFNVEDDLPVLR